LIVESPLAISLALEMEIFEKEEMELGRVIVECFGYLSLWITSHQIVT
jgi:hypothetical protein